MLTRMPCGYWKLGTKISVGALHSGVMPELEVEALAPNIKRHLERFPGDLAGVRAHDRLQRAPTGVEVVRVGLLVTAENGQVFIVPQVAVRVGVVGRVVPERVTHQRIVHRPQGTIHGADDRLKIARFISAFLL